MRILQLNSHNGMFNEPQTQNNVTYHGLDSHVCLSIYIYKQIFYISIYLNISIYIMA